MSETFIPEEAVGSETQESREQKADKLYTSASDLLKAAQKYLEVAGRANDAALLGGIGRFTGHKLSADLIMDRAMEVMKIVEGDNRPRVEHGKDAVGEVPVEKQESVRGQINKEETYKLAQELLSASEQFEEKAQIARDMGIINDAKYGYVKEMQEWAKKTERRKDPLNIMVAERRAENLDFEMDLLKEVKFILGNPRQSRGITEIEDKINGWIKAENPGLLYDGSNDDDAKIVDEMTAGKTDAGATVSIEIYALPDGSIKYKAFLHTTRVVIDA
jgi:hypothetical protein